MTTLCGKNAELFSVKSDDTTMLGSVDSNFIEVMLYSSVSQLLGRPPRYWAQASIKPDLCLIKKEFTGLRSHKG
jgi:hypothetical protein